MLWGSWPLCFTRLTTIISFSKRIKEKVVRTAKTPQMVQSTPKPNLTLLLSPSASPDASWVASLVSSLLHLRLRSFVIHHRCCHLLAANNRHLKPQNMQLHQFSAACISFLSQSMLLHELDATRLFLKFSAHFHSKPRCAPHRLLPLSSANNSFQSGLSTEFLRARRTASRLSTDAPG